MKGTGMLKRALCMAMVVMLLALTAAPALASKKPSGAYVVTTANSKNRLRVHSTPGGSVKKYLTLGTVVQYKSAKSGWWKVKYRKNKSELDTGYVDRHYLTSVSKLSAAKYTPVDNLWVRTKAKSSAAKIGKLKAGKKVSIIKQKGSWVCIYFKGYSGWVPAVYLKRVK